MRNWQAQITGAALFAAAAFLAGCGKPSSGTATGGGVIKVGEFASLTGSEATFGQSSHKGTALAVEEINAAGGVLGKKIELITEDDQSKPGESGNGACAS